MVSSSSLTFVASLILFTVIVFIKSARDPPLPPSQSTASIIIADITRSDSTLIIASTADYPQDGTDSGVDESIETTASDANSSVDSVATLDNTNASVDKTLDLDSEPTLEKLKSCDMYDGNWVRDEENYPIYEPGSCPYVDEAYDCHSNGRNDTNYLQWRWKPHHCHLPRFNAMDFLKKLRGKRMMFVGDSTNRNQFESLLCLLHQGLPNKTRMYERDGNKITKDKGFYVFIFEDYNCTVEFVRSHFLVKEGKRQPGLAVDQIDKLANRWKKADILVFNTGHWWTHGKTNRGINFYKEGDYVYPQLGTTEAYRIALKTWSDWIDKNIDPAKLVFYRGYSTTHFRGGEWDSGGSCNGETEPIVSGDFLDNYPFRMKIADQIIQKMKKVPVVSLNVTKLTNFRKDGHPSVYGKRINEVTKKRQDCSHWCLPGIPDAWNELIYATLLIRSHPS